MRRSAKIAAWGLGGLALLILLLIGAVFIAGNTDSGRAMIERITDRLTAGHVKLFGLTGSFPQALSLDRLELSDDRGIWLTAERVRLSWTPFAYLEGRLQIDSLQVAKIDMPRLPESSSKTTNNEPVSIPRIDVARMSVDLVQLGPQLAGAPTSLVLSGSAHLRSVQDMTFDAAAHRLNGEGDYQLQLHFDAKRMDAALKLHEPAGGPLENLIQLPGLGALTATLKFGGPRSAEQLDLSIDAGVLHGRAQGTMDMTTVSADLNFAFESGAMNPRADLGWDAATIKGRWQGSVKAPLADGHIEVSKLRLPGGTQLAGLNAELSASSGKATLRGLLRGLRLPGPQPGVLEDSPVSIVASMRLDQPTLPLELEASQRLFSLRAQAETAGIPAGKQNANLELRLLNLRALASLAGQNVAGTALVKAQVKGDASSMRVTLDANAALDVGKENWSALVGDRASLQLSGVLSEKAVTIESAKFAGRAVTLTADGNAMRTVDRSGHATVSTLNARWDLNVSDLRTLSAVLAGTAKASGTVAGPTTALAGEAQITSDVSVRGSPAGALSARVKMRGLPSAPSGTLEAYGLLDEAPLHVDVELLRSPAGSLQAVIHRAEWKSAHVHGDVTVATANAQAHGQLQLQMGQLADLQHLLGVAIGGSLSGSVVLRPVQGSTHAQFNLDAKNLALGQVSGNAQLTGEGVTDALRLKFDLQMPKLHGAAASASAAGSLNLDAHHFNLASVTVNYRGQDMHLLSPAKLTFADGLSIDLLKLGAQQAVLELRGQISPSLDIRASLRDVQASLVNVFSPGLLESGTIGARAQLKGSLTAPEGEIRLNASGMRLANDAAFGLPAVDLRASAQLMGNTAEIDARLVAGDASKLAVTGHAPLAVDGALNMKINGNLDVGMINPLLEARGQHATGALAIDATVTGSVEAPEIGGSVNLTKGSLRDYGRGVSITDMTAEVVGNAGMLQIKSFTAAAAPGTINVTGTVGVLQKGIPVDLKIKADNAQPIVSKLVTSNLNADLHVTGSARERLDIGGTVHLNRTVIGIPNSLPPNVAVLDVRRRGKGVPVAAGKDLVIGLDVAVQAPQELLVQGRGLDAEMGGELHLSGTTETPFVSGGFDLQRGSFSLAASRLNFTAGRVSFNGAGLKNKIDPTLDFTAQTTLANVTATLRITGPADAPQFEFTSSPSKPQDEIMALLLFGVPVQQLSGLQLAQIGAALASLSGVGGDSGLNPLVKLQRSLGLDRLTIGAATTNTAAGTENSGASIAAGRYIFKRVYVEAKQNTTGTSQLAADVELTKHLKLQTRLGNGTASVQGTTPENDPGSSVGLSYQFEY